MGSCSSSATVTHHDPPRPLGEDDHIPHYLKSTLTMALSEEEEANDCAAAAEASVDASKSSLSIFHEDILLSILSFVADVPFEMNNYGETKTMLISNLISTHIGSSCYYRGFLIALLVC